MISAVMSLAVGFVLQTQPIRPQTPDIVTPPAYAVPYPPGVSEAVKPLTPDEAVAISWKNHPSIASAEADLMAAKGRTQEAISNLYPTLSSSAQFSNDHKIGGSGTAAGRQSSANLSLQQLIFDFERTRNQARQQQALERVARARTTLAKIDASSNVRKAFHDYAEALRLVTISESNLENRKRQYALADARLSEGVGAPSDFIRSKTGLADAVLSLESARADALTFKVRLAEEMGVDPRTPFGITIDDKLPEALAEDQLQSLVNEALFTRPEILEAKERLNAAGYAVNVAQTLNAPRISAFSGLNGRGKSDPIESRTGNYGISVTWDIFDSGLRRGREIEARAVLQSAKANIQDATQTMISELSRAWVDLKSANQRVVTAQAQVENARELVRISEGRYGGGIGQFLEVTDAQTSLFTAERNLAQAIADARRAKVALDRAAGK